MRTASLVLGILALIGMCVGFLPCFGALNWINIPFAVIGLIISIVALKRMPEVPESGPKNYAIAGTVMCSIAVVFGLLRLVLGGGVV